MRRWVLEQARGVGLRPSVRRVRIEDLDAAEEMFLSNAIIGVEVGGHVRARQRARAAREPANGPHAEGSSWTPS